jgi:uncharacterized protein
MGMRSGEKMSFYFPIAEVAVNPWLVVGMGGLVGFASGMFGIGGGFLMTPLLILIGIPPSVAVGTQANQLVGASVSGALAQWRLRRIDIRMAMVLFTGGSLGSFVGVRLFHHLQKIGQADVVIALGYVLFLGTVSVFMLLESLQGLKKDKAGRSVSLRSRWHHHPLVKRLPFRLRFTQSHLYVSALLPMGIGFFIGILVAVLGIGGGFLLVPAMIYMLGMPASMVVGTSLLQIALVSALSTILHAVNTQTVDVLLAFFLLLGSAVGAQIGNLYAARISPTRLRFGLAVTVLGVCLVMLLHMTLPPTSLFTLDVLPSFDAE